MDLPDIQKKALGVLDDLDIVRRMPEEKAAEKEALWAKIVKEMKEFPKARPGLRRVYSSSLKRAAKTAELAALTANNLPPIHRSVAIKEIQLGYESDDDLTRQSEEALLHARGEQEALERLRLLYAERGLPDPMADTPENRRQLADPMAAFEGGDSTQGYAARVIKGYAAILTHALEEEVRPIEVILTALPTPDEEFINHVFTVQKQLQTDPVKGMKMFDMGLTYPPFVTLCRQLAGHRIVLARHGETVFSKQKILTGGHIDTDLINEGADAAVETGILLKLYNKTHPNDVKIIQIFGHSAASAIIEAAVCASCPQVTGWANAQFKVAEPHIFNFEEGGKVDVTRVSRQSLAEELRLAVTL